MLIIKTLIYAYIVFCEARFEPIKGKFAVAEVIEYRSYDIKQIFGKNQFYFKTGKIGISDISKIPECVVSGFYASNGLIRSGIGIKSHFNSNNTIPKNCKFVGRIGNHKFYVRNNERKR